MGQRGSWALTPPPPTSGTTPTQHRARNRHTREGASAPRGGRAPREGCTVEGRARWELVGLPESLQPPKPRCQHHKELLLPLGPGTPSTGTLGAPTGAASSQRAPAQRGLSLPASPTSFLQGFSPQNRCRGLYVTQFVRLRHRLIVPFPWQRAAEPENGPRCSKTRVRCSKMGQDAQKTATGSLGLPGTGRGTAPRCGDRDSSRPRSLGAPSSGAQRVLHLSSPTFGDRDGPGRALPTPWPYQAGCTGHRAPRHSQSSREGCRLGTSRLLPGRGSPTAPAPPDGLRARGAGKEAAPDCCGARLGWKKAAARGDGGQNWVRAASARLQPPSPGFQRCAEQEGDGRSQLVVTLPVPKRGNAPRGSPWLSITLCTTSSSPTM